jgi:hypothetical protein
MAARSKDLTVAALVAALIAGTLDFCFVRVYFHSLGIGFTRIGQSVAKGLLGPASFEGGVATALLGTALHFAIMFAFMLVYLLAARRIGFMRRHAVLSAIGYGLATFLVMNYVVVPLSRAAHPIEYNAWYLASIGVHVFFVGFGAMLADRWLQRRGG